jgi:hypothetical protein
MWLGSSGVLRGLGLERGAEATARQLALVLMGRHALTRTQLLQPGNGVVRSFELTFWAPESVAWVHRAAYGAGEVSEVIEVPGRRSAAALTGIEQDVDKPSLPR